MADNRVAYGLAKKYGIDTSGMSPKQVWEALKEKGVDLKSISEGAYDSKDNFGELRKKVSKSKKTQKLTSAVMNKYSTVRKKVDKLGYAIIYVNDGYKGYIVRINKSDNDFDYDIIKEEKENE